MEIFNIKCLFIYIAITILKTKARDIKNDYCHINESKLAHSIITDLIEYLGEENINNKNCMLANKNLTNYIERFIYLDEQNIAAYTNFKCFDCDKRFKRKDQLHLHYRLFHLNENQYYCPSDFCRFLNCDRYKSYFQIEKYDYTTLAPAKQVREKELECNKELISFYRNSCMKLIDSCISNPENYFLLFKNFCAKINCEEGKGSILYRETHTWETFHVIVMYLVSLLIFLYLLIIWVNKYS
jgi:hypothetical protein